jgi:hypothetical protein
MDDGNSTIIVESMIDGFDIGGFIIDDFIATGATVVEPIERAATRRVEFPTGGDSNATIRAIRFVTVLNIVSFLFPIYGIQQDLEPNRYKPFVCPSLTKREPLSPCPDKCVR